MKSAADRYAALLSAGIVSEDEASVPLLRRPELEIQARWFSGEFGREFPLADGRTAHIVQFGVWNREAGPDFSETAIQIGGDITRGCIEIDSDPMDWEAHGHATNPAYENVVLHLCTRPAAREFFTRTLSHRLVPRGVLDLAGASAEGFFTVPGAKPGRCLAPLAEAGEEKVLSILRAAAQHRLRKKSARLARAEAIHGRDEALFQAVAAALGYKFNKLPFTLLAQRLPLRKLLEDRAGAAALLFGLGGFLYSADLREFPRAARPYLRELWDQWWRRRGDFERLVLPASSWRMGGVRPLNHPQRRLAALAALLDHWPTLRRFARQPEPARFLDFCSGLHDDFWDVHYTLTSRPSPRRMSLIGASRAADLLANVFFPFASLTDPNAWKQYEKLSAPLGNRRVTTAAIRLFGTPAACAPSLRRMVHQQGLLQIYEDFCMRDATDCAQCRFPEQLANW